MKSTTGEHYLALDHVRALAAFLVFSWHFLHGYAGTPIAFDYTPSVFPLAIIDEGYTGVALFMTLSGYLFAKLLRDREIDFRAFLWNRAVRLVPLLVVALVIGAAIEGARGGDLIAYGQDIAIGAFLPTLPGAMWSLTVEMHFYLLLPILLLGLRRSPRWLIVVLVAALASRLVTFGATGQIRQLSYLTIIGRIDQFVLGMLAYHLHRHIRGRHGLAISSLAAPLVGFWLIDRQGDRFNFLSVPSHRVWWAFLPPLEGLAYGVLIAWYDTSFKLPRKGVSALVGRFGTYSYSIYLLHFFLVFEAARFIDRHVMSLSNFYVAATWSTACFGMMLPIGWLSYRFIESPFLRYRRRYIVERTRLRIDRHDAAIAA